MQLHTLITAEELPIHLHIRGQSERTALRKLQPCNLQPLSSGGEQSHIHTRALSSELYHSRTYTRTLTHTLALVVSLPGPLNSSMRGSFHQSE